jgi:hypothetical protein
MPIEELPLWPALRERLRRWQSEFDVFPEAASRPDSFDEVGRVLLAAVRGELGADWHVVSSWYDTDAAALAEELNDTGRLPLEQQFERLPADTRREVERLAKRGQPHPDPAVAAAARAWATSYHGAGEVTFGRRRLRHHRGFDGWRRYIGWRVVRAAPVGPATTRAAAAALLTVRARPCVPVERWADGCDCLDRHPAPPYRQHVSIRRPGHEANRAPTCTTTCTTQPPRVAVLVRARGGTRPASALRCRLPLRTGPPRWAE